MLIDLFANPGGLARADTGGIEAAGHLQLEDDSPAGDLFSPQVEAASRRQGNADMMFAAGHDRTAERCGSSEQSIRAKFEYFRFGRPRSDREYLTIAKLTAGVASLLMIAGAIVICYIPKESINDFSLIIGSLFGGGVLSIFLLGFFTTRVGYRAVLLWAEPARVEPPDGVDDGTKSRKKLPADSGRSQGTLNIRKTALSGILREKSRKKFNFGLNF